MGEVSTVGLDIAKSVFKCTEIQRAEAVAGIMRYASR